MASVTAAAVLRTSVQRSIGNPRALSQWLTTPHKVAHALDWRMASGSLLSVVVQKDSLQVAVASHPVFCEDAKELPPIPWSVCHSNNTSTTAAETLQRIVGQYNVCGWIVAWPVQREGWVGASCGRVLHTLDHMAGSGRVPLRPVCLYDATHTAPPPIDEWGRCALYSTVSHQSVHVASHEQYDSHVVSSPSHLCRDFMREHWPTVAMTPTDETKRAAAFQVASKVPLYQADDSGARQMAYF